MNADAFLEGLPLLFDDFPSSPEPRDGRFAEVLEAIPGLACQNNLALLNLAASLLEPDEVYLEAGTFRGTSLVSALLGNESRGIGLDDFSREGGSRAQAQANLSRFGVAERAEIRDGDAFELLREPGSPLPPVGVYYYDAAHGYEEQLDGLRLAEPHLAEGALLIVDDSDWEQVERAITDYLAAQPRARLLLRIDGKDRGRPQWWEGMTILGWGAAAKKL